MLEFLVYIFFKYAVQEPTICSLFNQLVEINLESENLGPISTKLANASMNFIIIIIIIIITVIIIVFMFYIDI